MPEPANESPSLTCMEVWGGNDSTHRSVRLPGLRLWMFSEVYDHQLGGGDVYYVSSCATGRITRMLLADVSGHGSAVNAPAERLRQLMRRHVNQIDQRRFVRAMNSAFTDFTEDGLFATAVVASYFSPSQTLTLTNAGHPPPLLYQARTHAWRLLEQDPDAEMAPINIPLGILDLSEYDQHSLRLHPGDRVLCYSDALIECRDGGGNRIGCRGLKDVLGRIDAGPHAQLLPALLQRLRALHPGNLQEDDLSALLFSPDPDIEGGAWRPGLKVHLKAMRQFLHAALASAEPVPWPDLHPANLGGSIISSLNKLWGRGLE